MLKTKDDESLLIYLETCAVDFGRGGGEKMNAEEIVIARLWSESGYIGFGRLPSHMLREGRRSGDTHWVKLSPEAYADAARLRMERGQRNKKKIDEMLAK